LVDVSNHIFNLNSSVGRYQFCRNENENEKRKTKFQFAGEAAKRQKLIEIVGQQKQKVHSSFDQHWIKTSFQIEHANRKFFVNTFTSA
jgi:hypothetical protein